MPTERELDAIIGSYVLWGSIVAGALPITMFAWKHFAPQPRPWLRRYACLAAAFSIAIVFVTRPWISLPMAVRALYFVMFCLWLEIALSSYDEIAPAVARIVSNDRQARRS